MRHTTIKRARTWHYRKMRPCTEQSNGPVSLSPFPSWPDRSMTENRSLSYLGRGYLTEPPYHLPRRRGSLSGDFELGSWNNGRPNDNARLHEVPDPDSGSAAGNDDPSFHRGCARRQRNERTRH